MYDLKSNTAKVRVFREKTVEYYHHKGRHQLPWRKTNDPWKILLAEILLRKTTAIQAGKVYETVCEFSPEVLSEIDPQDLEDLLKPVKPILKDFLSFNDEENEFITQLFDNKIYDPDILFKNIKHNNQIKEHPGIKWRIQNM